MPAQMPLIDDPGTMRTLASDMVAAVPEDQREEAVEELLETLARIYREHRVELPPWLAALRGGGRHSPMFIALERLLYLETLRTPLRDAAQKCNRGVAGLARVIGVPVRPLRHFLAGGELPPTTWDAVSEYVLKHAEVFPGPASFGLSVTVSVLPPPIREAARQAMAHALRRVLDRNHIAEPEWLELETDWPLL